MKTVTREPDEERRSICPDCGGGWTFDFARRCIYCKACVARQGGEHVAANGLPIDGYPRQEA